MGKLQKYWRVFRLNMALSSGDETWQRFLNHHQDQILDFDNHSDGGLIDVYVKKAIEHDEWHRPKTILSRLLEAGCGVNERTFQRLTEAKVKAQGSDAEMVEMLDGMNQYLRQHVKEAPTPLSF